MTELRTLPNIGPVFAKKLAEVDIHTVKELRSQDAKEVFLKLRAVDSTLCLSSLYGIAGAIKGVRWHELSKEEKENLKCFFHSLEDTN